jgi:hypothetical protein
MNNAGQPRALLRQEVSIAGLGTVGTHYQKSPSGSKVINDETMPRNWVTDGLEAVIALPSF